MFDFSDMNESIKILPGRMEKAIMAYGDTVSKKLQSYAREERPWTDRTAQARQRLKGYCVKKDGAIRIYLAHGVDYGVDLEFKYEKRYAVIYPVLRREAPKVIQGLWKAVR